MPVYQKNRIPKDKTTSWQEWDRVIQSRFNIYKKILRKNKDNRDDRRLFDYTDILIKRRKQALLNTISAVLNRYSKFTNIRDILGETWIDLNMPFLTYSQLDSQSHILFAASMWILDRITKQENWRNIYKLLPTDEKVIDDLCLHDVWDAEYDYDLIYSVEFVLHNRNPIEVYDREFEPVLTSELLAKKGKQQSNAEIIDQNRKNYDDLIAMVPQEDIDRAVKHLRVLFWQWVDRYFESVEPFLQAESEYDRKIPEISKQIDTVSSELKALAKGVKSGKKKSPILALNNIDVQAVMHQLNGSSSITGFLSDQNKAANVFATALSRLEKLEDEYNQMIDRAIAVHNEHKDFMTQIIRRGHVVKDILDKFEEVSVQAVDPMRIDDPYELCFALLYLIEQDDDLPWLYGAGCGFMAEVIETLPWGIYEYEEEDDDIWEEMDGEPYEGEEEMPVEIDCEYDEDDALIDQIPGFDEENYDDENKIDNLPEQQDIADDIPDFYSRTYRGNEDFDFPRNLAQIIYEETGCVLPKDLHLYDSKAGILAEYGITGKDAQTVLLLMSVLAHARRSHHPLNLDMDLDLLFGTIKRQEEEETGQKEQDETNPLKVEIKRLRSALYTAEKESRETKKKLSALETSTEDMRREVTISGTIDSPGTVTAIENGATATLGGTTTEGTNGTFHYSVSYSAAEPRTHLKNVTVTNERNDTPVVLKLTDMQGNPLDTAIFTLKNSSGVVLGTYHSNSSGLITNAYLLTDASYTLTQTEAKIGYRGLASSITFSVSESGEVTVESEDTAYYTKSDRTSGSPASITVKNPLYTITIHKKDKDTDEALKGAVFSLHKKVKTGEQTSFDQTAMTGYEALTTDESGNVRIPGYLDSGTYLLREITPPAQYKPIIGDVIVFEIDNMGNIELNQNDPGFLEEGLNTAKTNYDYVLTVVNEKQMPSPTNVTFSNVPYFLMALAGMVILAVILVPGFRRKGKHMRAH